MKDRPKYFLASDKIDQDSEIFDYIRELHEYLWRFVRCKNPSASGDLQGIIDNEIEELEKQSQEAK